MSEKRFSVNWISPIYLSVFLNSILLKNRIKFCHIPLKPSQKPELNQSQQIMPYRKFTPHVVEHTTEMNITSKLHTCSLTSTEIFLPHWRVIFYPKALNLVHTIKQFSHWQQHLQVWTTDLDFFFY